MKFLGVLVIEYSIRDFSEIQTAGAYELLRCGSIMTPFLGGRVSMLVRQAVAKRWSFWLAWWMSVSLLLS